MAVGDQVFGVTNTQFVGAYAEYAVASAAMIAKKPSSLSYVEAASVPVIAVTAWQGLFDQARLEAGQTVVIHGAAGNVGAYAVQLAHRARLRSIATAGTKDIDYVRALGADKVVDYHTQRFEDEVKDADAVLDLVGGETQARSLQVLRPRGKLISAVSQPDQERAKHYGVNAAFFLVEVSTERLRTIAELIDRGFQALVLLAEHPHSVTDTGRDCSRRPGHMAGAQWRVTVGHLHRCHRPLCPVLCGHRDQPLADDRSSSVYA
jgi:NADPH:quinone reductase-like Zn-dependent oxidoreductase